MLSAFPHRFETEDNSYDIVRSAWVNGAHYFACGENRERGAFLDVYKDGKRLEYTGGGPGGSNKSSNATNTSTSTSSSPTGDAGATSNSTRLKVSDTTICLLTALEFVPGYNTAQKSDLLLAAGFSHGGVSLFHTENLECILTFSLKPGFVISSFGFTGVVETVDNSGGSSTASAASPAAGSASASHKTTDEEEDALFWIVHNHVDTQTLSSNLRKWHAAAQQAKIKAAAATSPPPSSSPTGDGSGAPPGGSSAITSDGTSKKEQIEQGRFSRTNSGPKTSNPLFDSPRPRTGSDGGTTAAFSSTRPAPGTAVVKKAGVTTVKNFGQAAGSSTEKNAEGTSSSSKTPYPHDPSSELADQDRSFVARVPFACIRQAVAKTFPVPESANFRAELLEFPIEFQVATTLFFRRNMVKEFSPTDLAFFNGGGGSGGNLYVSDLRRGLELAATSAEEEELIMSTTSRGSSLSPRTSQLSGRSAGRENHDGTSSRSNLPSTFVQAGQTVKSSSSTAAAARQQLYQKNLLKQHDRNQVLAVGRNPMIAKCDNMYNDPKNAPSVSALVGSAVDFFMGRFAGTTTAAKSPRVR